jgi:hypothetical protein
MLLKTFTSAAARMEICHLKEQLHHRRIKDPAAAERHESLAEDYRSCQIQGWDRAHRSAGKPRRLVSDLIDRDRAGTLRVRKPDYRAAQLWWRDHVKVSRSHPCRS